MAQPIEQLTVSCFDVHVSFDPLLYPEQLAPAARFLADASDYRKQQSAPQPLELPGFRVFPLRSELDDNHFWRQFASARPSFAGGVHDFLLPFRCRPKSFDAWAKAPAVQKTTRTATMASVRRIFLSIFIPSLPYAFYLWGRLSLVPT